MWVWVCVWVFVCVCPISTKLKKSRKTRFCIKWL